MCRISVRTPPTHPTSSLHPLSSPTQTYRWHLCPIECEGDGEILLADGYAMAFSSRGVKGEHFLSIPRRESVSVRNAGHTATSSQSTELGSRRYLEKSVVMFEGWGRSMKGHVLSDSEGDREGVWGRPKALMLLGGCAHIPNLSPVTRRLHGSV